VNASVLQNLLLKKNSLNTSSTVTISQLLGVGEALLTELHFEMVLVLKWFHILKVESCVYSDGTFG
jgi:hypothetical protein